MHTVEDIDGINVARGVGNADSCSLTLMAPGGFSGEGQIYYPPESLTINTLAGVAALRDLCERLIEAHNEASQAGG